MQTTRPVAAPAALVAVLVILFPALPAPAQSVPTTLNYQGRLLQNTAAQDAITGTVDVVFSIWSGPASDDSAVELWSESWAGVELSNGIFSVLLGSNGSPLNPADFQGDTSLFLQLEIDGEVLLPRQQLGSAPFAMVDEPANELQDLELTGTTLSLTNDATPVDLSGFLDNTDVQTLALSGDSLTISGSGSSVDIAGTTTIRELLQFQGRIEARMVFVSSQTYTGSLGGLPGADAECQALADAAGLTGTYLAWLGDSTGSPSTRFVRSGSFQLVDGTRIADDWADLTDGSLQNPIARDEVGDSVTGDFVWTNTETDGTTRDSNDCGDWTSGASSVSGNFGRAFRTDSLWTFGGFGSCSLSRRLYCFEQTPAPSGDNQELSLAGTDLQLTSDDGPDVVSLAGFLDNTDSQNLASVLAFGSNGGGRDIQNVDLVEANAFRGHGLDCPNCVDSNDIAPDTIRGNDINDNIYILHVDCNGECNDMSVREACNVIENLRGLSTHVELIDVSCVHDIPSSSANGFVACNDGSQDIGDNECRAFNLRTLGDLPCIDGNGTDALVTCLETDLPK